MKIISILTHDRCGGRFMKVYLIICRIEYQITETESSTFPSDICRPGERARRV